MTRSEIHLACDTSSPSSCRESRAQDASSPPQSHKNTPNQHSWSSHNIHTSEMASPHSMTSNLEDWNQGIRHNPRFFLHCTVCNFYADVQRTVFNPLGWPWICGPCEAHGVLEPCAAVVRHVSQQIAVSPPPDGQGKGRWPWPRSMSADRTEVQFIGLSCARCDWDTIVRRESATQMNAIVKCWQCGGVDGTVMRVVGVVVFMDVEQ